MSNNQGQIQPQECSMEGLRTDSAATDALVWIPSASLSPFMERFLPYRGQYVAVQENRLIAHHKLAEVLKEARASDKPFTIYAIPKELGKLRIL
ncbi:MAG: hypothetical protein H8D67_05355 [Deltaproteobacteria bacterium]|nr:hypothetical protein [Deltaproteobacteria bacterium]